MGSKKLRWATDFVRWLYKMDWEGLVGQELRKLGQSKHDTIHILKWYLWKPWKSSNRQRMECDVNAG